MERTKTYETDGTHITYTSEYYKIFTINGYGIEKSFIVTERETDKFICEPKTLKAAKEVVEYYESIK